MNREQWLTNALTPIAALFKSATSTRANSQPLTLPIETIKVSVGFPRNTRTKKNANSEAIGQCWSSDCSAERYTEIFISPTIADPIRALDILIHECIHATIGNEHGHKAPFKRAAKALGLEGKATHTTAGPELTKRLNAIANELGPYPHAALTPGAAGAAGTTSGKKKQSTRMIKVECSCCGYTVRTTQTWLDKSGAPLCPTNTCDNHTQPMEPAQ